MTSSPRKGRPSAISAIGLTGAPVAAAVVNGTSERPAEPTSGDHDVTTSRSPEEAQASGPGRDVVKERRRDVTTSRRREGVPRAVDGVAYTLRLTQEDALSVDELVLRLRRETGRRVLDKSEVFRALLYLVSEAPAVHERLVNKLRDE